MICGQKRSLEPCSGCSGYKNGVTFSACAQTNKRPSSGSLHVLGACLSHTSDQDQTTIVPVLTKLTNKVVSAQKTKKTHLKKKISLVYCRKNFNMANNFTAEECIFRVRVSDPVPEGPILSRV